MSYHQTPRPPRLQNPPPYGGTDSFGASAIPPTPTYEVAVYANVASPPLEPLVSPHGDVAFDPFRSAYFKFRDSEGGEEHDPSYRRAKQLADGTLQPSKEGGFWPRPSAEATYPDNKTVFVGNLPSNAAAWELERYFGVFGPLVSANIPKNKPNCGFVTYVHRADAELAIDRMQAFPLHGSQLRPSWGHSQRDKLSRSVPIQTQLAQDQDFLADLLELNDSKRSQLKLYIHTLMDGTVDSFKTFCHLSMKPQAKIEPIRDDSLGMDRLSLDNGYLGGGLLSVDDTPRHRLPSATDPFASHGPLADSVNALVDSTELAGGAAWSAGPSTSTSSSDLHSTSERASSPTSSLESDVMRLNGASSSTDHDRFFRAFATGPSIPMAPASASTGTGTASNLSFRSHSGSFSEFERGNALSDNIDLRPRAGSHDSGAFHVGNRLQMSSSNPPAGISTLVTNLATSLAGTPSATSSSGSTVRAGTSTGTSTGSASISAEPWIRGRDFYPSSSSSMFR